MLPRLSKLLLLLVSLPALFVTTALAQSFQVSLGDRTLGTLTYARDGKMETMNSTLNNTPLGVFNGSYKGKSQPVRTEAGAKVLQYFGVKESTRKSRKTSVLLDQGKAIETLIDPSSDRTNVSEIAEVPALVVDPVAAFGRLISSSGCPSPFKIYDGRRVITLAPIGMDQKDNLLSCDLRYTVTNGPGHLSPLYINSISVGLTYENSNGQSTLMSVRFSSGPFKVKMIRQN